MLKKIIRLFNCLILNNIKFLIIKIFHYKNFIYSPLNLVSPLASIDIQGKGRINIRKKCNILNATIIGVREEGIVSLNKGVFINRNCNIIAHNKIEIGTDTCIGPNTIIIDHDHKYGINGVEKKEFNSKEILIGENVWIGANCVILKGIKIGDNSVISAGSVVTKDIPKNTIFIQKRKNEFISLCSEKSEIE